METNGTFVQLMRMKKRRIDKCFVLINLDSMHGSLTGRFLNIYQRLVQVIHGSLTGKSRKYLCIRLSNVINLAIGH
jgi:hypothetical protein